MTRFLGLLLMVTTGAVAAPFLTHAFTSETRALIVLGGALAGLGLLFGFLATARHIVWAIIAAVAILSSLLSPWVEPAGSKLDAQPRSSAFRAVSLALPPVVLIAFSAIGARLIARKSLSANASGED